MYSGHTYSHVLGLFAETIAVAATVQFAAKNRSFQASLFQEEVEHRNVLELVDSLALRVLFRSLHPLSDR